MAGFKKTIKYCGECGKKIKGKKDFCTSCHAKILEKIKERKKSKTTSGWI
jgi:predicted nucleic acid-binding Zn ribbon protein